MPTKEQLNFTDTKEIKEEKDIDYKASYENLKKAHEALAKRFDKLAELYGIIVEKYLEN